MNHHSARAFLSSVASSAPSAPHLARYVRPSCVVHLPPLVPEQCSDPAISVPAEPYCQHDNVSDQRLFIVQGLQSSALCRSGLIDHPAGPALRDCGQHPLDVLHALAAIGRAQKFPSAASFRICLSSARSATVQFSRAFSCSSLLSRFARSRLSPPYSRRHR